MSLKPITADEVRSYAFAKDMPMAQALEALKLDRAIDGAMQATTVEELRESVVFALAALRARHR